MSIEREPEGGVIDDAPPIRHLGGQAMRVMGPGAEELPGGQLDQRPLVAVAEEERYGATARVHRDHGAADRPPRGDRPPLRARRAVERPDGAVLPVRAA